MELSPFEDMPFLKKRFFVTIECQTLQGCSMLLLHWNSMNFSQIFVLG